MKHIEGKNNNVTDTLSHISAVSIGLDSDELAKAQLSDSEINTLFSSKSSLQLRKYSVPDFTESVFCGFTLGRPRP